MFGGVEVRTHASSSSPALTQHVFCAQRLRRARTCFGYLSSGEGKLYRYGRQRRTIFGIPTPCGKKLYGRDGRVFSYFWSYSAFVQIEVCVCCSVYPAVNISCTASLVNLAVRHKLASPRQLVSHVQCNKFDNWRLLQMLPKPPLKLKVDHISF